MPCQGEFHQFCVVVFALALLHALAGCSPQAAGRAAATSSAAYAVAPEPTRMPAPGATPAPRRTAAAELSPTPQSPAATPTPRPTITPEPSPTPRPPEPRFGYPIGRAGRTPGDGFFIRHGYAVENTWYNPGHWHTGEDWYAREGETAGAEVYTIADGTVVYVGANYPGRVVIVEHGPELYSMYGHLDPAVAVTEGQPVARGALLGVVLRRGDDVPDHLHFEVRTFLTTGPVNGAAPRYGFRCGPRCPPGPGYWPIGAPEHPSDLGWRNPTHVIAGRVFGDVGGRGVQLACSSRLALTPLPPIPRSGRGGEPAARSGYAWCDTLGEVVVAAGLPRERATLWSAPPVPGAAQEAVGELDLTPGTHLRLLEVWAGAEDARATSAEAYVLWYRVGLDDGREGWVQAAVPSRFEQGGDGRPSSVDLILLPAP